jgi:hypothetical protein
MHWYARALTVLLHGGPYGALKKWPMRKPKQERIEM